MLPFSQRLQMRGIQANLLRQIGKELSIYYGGKNEMRIYNYDVDSFK